MTTHELETGQTAIVAVVPRTATDLRINEEFSNPLYSVLYCNNTEEIYDVIEFAKHEISIVGTIQHPGVFSFDPAPFLVGPDPVNGLFEVAGSTHTVDSWVNSSGRLNTLNRTEYVQAETAFLSRLASWGYYWVNPLGEKESCPEFPYFGAHYPDARCIGGELWDLDKYEDGQLYSTGDNPVCPFCRTDDFMQEQKDNEEDLDAVREWMQRIRDRYGNKAWHKAESRKLSVEQMVVVILIKK